MTGTTLSHYRVLERLGEGATAVVYKAEDLALGRPVALKLLPSSLSVDLGKLARFQHEARTTSSLNHPNICTIYEIGEHDGRHFIVMEYLEGKPLSRIIDNRPIEGYRLIELAIQIADGLEAAHEARVIHRDLKPANIYVSERDHVKLLDFGLATLMPASQTRSSSSSATWLAEPGGTGPYLSPEQTLGEPLDTRSDLFTLGVVLYEMATGARPFMGATQAALIDAIRHERAFPPRDMNTAVRDELDRIINKALEKNRKLRYQTASDVSADLRRLKRDIDASPQLTARPVATPPAAAQDPEIPAPEQARSAFGATRRHWVIAQLVGAALVGGIFVALGFPSKRVDEHRPANPPVAAALPAPPAYDPGNMVPGPIGPGLQAASPGPIGPGLQAASPGPVGPGLQVAAADPPGPSQPRSSSYGGQGGPGLRAAGPGLRVPAADPPGPKGPGLQAALRSAEGLADLHIYDQALDILQHAVRDNANSASAPAAYLMMASIHERRGKIEDAIAVYLDTAVRFPADARAPQALFEMAGAIQKSKHDAKDQQAAKTYTEIATQYRSSPWAARALMARAEIEQRRRQMQVDPLLGRPAPAALATYREIVQMHPASPEREHALWRLSLLYQDLKRFDLATDALRELGTHYASTGYDAWFIAAEIYQKKMNEPSSARTAYAQVPPTSPHWDEAQKRLSSN